MLEALPPLILRNGVRIDNVLEMALEFVAHDGSYQTYDLARVKQDDTLTEADIRVANAMIARMSPRVVAGIYARAPVINAALRRVPASASLSAPDDAVPWDALEHLLRAVDGIPEVGLPRQTKVLHKKRPALIPIMDSVLVKYLRSVERVRRTGDGARDAVELIRSYKRELDAALPVLQPLQHELRHRGVGLTECRLLDLFLWAYSGTYMPLYRRAVDGGQGVSSVTPKVGSEARMPTVRRVELRIFRNDDRGYLAWLAEHPTGFVVNMSRSPRADYVILHRAACRTISGRPARGGPWTGPYIKGCANDDLEIAAWCGRELGVAPKRCGICLR